MIQTRALGQAAALTHRTKLGPSCWRVVWLGVLCGCSQQSGEGSAAQKTNAAVVGAAQDPLSAVHVKAVGHHGLSAQLELVGSVVYDPDHVALVGPLVSGRIASLAAKSSTKVRRGQLLAEVESPEAGQAQAQWITTRARLRAAQAQLARERELAQKHISSARDLELAEAQAAQEKAENDAAQERLQAFGLSADANAPHILGGRVPLRSPIDGIVVTRYVSLGQAVERATDAFLVADLSRLWVQLEIYEKDLERVHVGQHVELRTESLPGQVLPAKVAFIEPVVDLKTRTANIRLEFVNAEAALRPGQFVTARITQNSGDTERMVLAIERSALQTLGNKQIVYVQTPTGFVARPISVGLHDATFIEVTAGLDEGEMVVVEGAFLIKANQAQR